MQVDAQAAGSGEFWYNFFLLQGDAQAAGSGGGHHNAAHHVPRGPAEGELFRRVPSQGASVSAPLVRRAQ